MIRFGWFSAAIALCLAAAPVLAMDSGNSNGSYAAPPTASDDSGYMAKARSAIAAKDYQGAVAILAKLFQGDPKNADAANLLGFSYRMLGRYLDAFFYYDKALALDPGHKGALEYEGEAYLETNQLPKAEANLAALKSACSASGCEEVARLQTAIDRYRAKAKVN